MLYHSTNRNVKGGFDKKVNFSTALFAGIAPDGGLFMPESYPFFSKEDIFGLTESSYSAVATEVLKDFFADGVSAATLAEMAAQAYTFDVRLEPLGMDGITVAWMDGGPTASFKDFGAQLMGRLMEHLKPKGVKITVLVATSGDTGSAVAEAFKNLVDIDVVLLFPKNEVSPVQRKQLTAYRSNVLAVEIEGKFDDCQRCVKRAFQDEDLKGLNLTSANSINIGRLLPQIVYYFYTYLRVAKNFESINFCIPTGNFGNAMACILAKKMGLPVHRIIVATNANDALTTWLQTGVYQKINPSKESLSNAMNVGNPNNLSRLFDLFGGNLDSTGVTMAVPDIEMIREMLASFSITDDETVSSIKEAYADHQIVLEPHGAVGLWAMKRYRTQFPDNRAKTILLETASPAKFPEVIEKELHITPELPQSLRDMMSGEQQVIPMDANYEKFKDFLLKNC